MVELLGFIRKFLSVLLEHFDHLFHGDEVVVQFVLLAIHL